jgi:hypothetical protein
LASTPLNGSNGKVDSVFDLQCLGRLRQSQQNTAT